MIKPNPQRVEAVLAAFMDLHQQEYEREQEDDPLVILLSKCFENGRINDSTFSYPPDLYWRAQALHYKSTKQKNDTIEIKEN